MTFKIAEVIRSKRAYRAQLTPILSLKSYGFWGNYASGP